MAYNPLHINILWSHFITGRDPLLLKGIDLGKKKFCVVKTTQLHGLGLTLTGMSQKFLKSSYFFIQSIWGALLFSLEWSFIFSSAAVALSRRPISAKGSNSRLPSSSASCTETKSEAFMLRFQSPAEAERALLT